MLRRAVLWSLLLASAPALAGEPDPSEPSAREPIGSELAAGTMGGLLGFGVGFAGGVVIGHAFCGNSLDCLGYGVVGMGVGAALGVGGGIAYGGNRHGRTGSYAAAIGGTVVGAGAGIGITVLAIVSTEDPAHPDSKVIPIGIAGTALTVLAGYGGGLLGYHLTSEASGTAMVTALPIAHGGGLALAGTF
ncbi:MAG: hypothetical protein ABI678_11330 [Kofleriaceae bacterium]